MERKTVELILQGKSNREICRELKIGDRKVRRARALAETYGYLRAPFGLGEFPRLQAITSVSFRDGSRISKVIT